MNSILEWTLAILLVLCVIAVLVIGGALVSAGFLALCVLYGIAFIIEALSSLSSKRSDEERGGERP